MKSLFNIVFHDGNTKFPDDKILYIATKNGIFLRKDLGTIRSCIPVNKISFLKELTPYAELKIPQIDTRHISRALGFLKWVYATHHSEGGLIIYYNPQTHEYIIHAPKQKVSACAVNWDNTVESIPKDFIRMGTIHSHADMSAFHSGTDVQDEENFDGLHITMGHLGAETPTIVASVVVNGTRFPVSKEEIRRYLDINPIDETTETKMVKKTDEAPIYEDYRAYLSKRNGAVKSNFPTRYNTVSYIYVGKNEMKFQIPNVQPRDLDFPHEWKNRVEKETYTGGGIYRVVNGKVVKLENNKQIGFVPSGNASFWSQDELNDFGYDNFDYYKNPFGVNSNVGQHFGRSDDLYPSPHPTCDDCMYKIIAEEAIEQGFDFEELIEEDSSFSGDDPRLINEEEEVQHYGKHTSSDGNPDSISFDEEGNIIDEDGNIVERLVKENEND